MTTTVPVGQFSTLTQLSVKTLRHYHEVDLLAPARVDPQTGYRYYSLDQLPTAQLIRRLRDLKMPIPEVRSVLVATDPAERNRLISAHLDRLETELADTRAAVTSLRTLLDTARARAPISRRHVSALNALAITDTVEPGGLGPWWEGALHELRAFARDEGVIPAGPAGGIFAEEVYQQEPAQALVYLPVAAGFPGTFSSGRIRSLKIPAAELAITTHFGPAADIDLAYADLGSYLAENQLQIGNQIREHYVIDHSETAEAARWQTEIGWPIVGG